MAAHPLDSSAVIEKMARDLDYRVQTALGRRYVCDLFPCAKDALPVEFVMWEMPGTIGERQVSGPGVNLTRRTYCPTDAQMETLQRAGGWLDAIARLTATGQTVRAIEQMDAPEILRRLAGETAREKSVNKLNQLTNIAFDERERLDLMASGRLSGMIEYLRDIAPTVGLSRFAKLANEVRVIARQRSLFPFPELDALATARDKMLVRCWDMVTCDGLRPLDASEFDDALVKLDSFSGAFVTSSASDMKAEVNSEPSKPVEMQAKTLAECNETTESEFEFRPNGDGFYLKGFGQSGHVTAKGAKGLRDLFRLVQTPGVPVPMLELDAGPGVEQAEGDGQSRQPVADGVTIKQLATKRKQLKADIESAGSDMERSELETELAELEETAKGMRGLNGKPRDLNNPLDKLRPKLLKRISTAGERLREANLDKLAGHFGLTVSSEAGCLVYRPAIEGLTWNVAKL